MTHPLHTDDAPKIVVDLDGTVCHARQPGETYADVAPRGDVIERLHTLRGQGYRVVIHTSRNMRTYDGDIGLINVHTAPVVLDWLQRHGVPHDEVVFGKPWPGPGGFYVDDKAVRPDEFARYSLAQIQELIGDA